MKLRFLIQSWSATVPGELHNIIGGAGRKTAGYTAPAFSRSLVSAACLEPELATRLSVRAQHYAAVPELYRPYYGRKPGPY